MTNTGPKYLFFMIIVIIDLIFVSFSSYATFFQRQMILSPLPAALIGWRPQNDQSEPKLPVLHDILTNFDVQYNK